LKIVDTDRLCYYQVEVEGEEWLSLIDA